MNTSFRTHTILFALVVVIAVFIYSCGEDTVTPPPTANFNCFTDTNTPAAGIINGTISFYDTNRVYPGLNGYYDVSAYTSWPPAGPPSASDSIDLNKVNDVYKGCYQLNNLPPSGTFYIVAAFIKLPYAQGSVFVSGMYGCDTNAICIFTNPGTVILNGSAGAKNINFNADLDTANMQIRF